MEKREQLIEKIKKEFENFTDEVLNEDKAEIMTRGFEITIKSLIKNFLTQEVNDFSDKQVSELLETESILDFFYESYMDENEYMDIEELLAEFIFEIMEDIDSEEEQN